MLLDYFAGFVVDFDAVVEVFAVASVVAPIDVVVVVAVVGFAFVETSGDYVVVDDGAELHSVGVVVGN